MCKDCGGINYLVKRFLFSVFAIKSDIYTHIAHWYSSDTRRISPYKNEDTRRMLSLIPEFGDGISVGRTWRVLRTARQTRYFVPDGHPDLRIRGLEKRISYHLHYRCHLFTNFHWPYCFSCYYPVFCHLRNYVTCYTWLPYPVLLCHALRRTDRGRGL